MKTEVRKPVAPFYAVAVLWIVYALLFPLYAPAHYALLTAASAAVYLIAGALCKSGGVLGEKKAAPKAERKQEAPSTGNAELDKMLRDGRLAIAEMKRLDDNIADPGVSGENIDGTLNKVEGMMRNIVAAFEKQLDALYGSEALDISTDISVLETMMAREGLTGQPLKAETLPKDDPDIRLEL